MRATSKLAPSAGYVVGVSAECQTNGAMEAKRLPVTGGRFLTAKEAAVYLGSLNHRTVTLWARQGYLPAIPVGEGKRRLWRFLETDLERWMLARRQRGYMPSETDERGYNLNSHRCSNPGE